VTAYTARDAWQLRAAAVVMVVGLAWFIPWMVLHLDLRLAWIAVPFAAAHIVLALNLILAVVNNWSREHPPQRILLSDEPIVGVLIPTAGEPVHMVERTIRSVLEQDWPLPSLRVVVGDDAHRPEIEALVRQIQRDVPGASVTYHHPEPRGSRRGEGKAGNLNSALRTLGREVRFIETRDADDEVGDPMFLRHCVGQLVADPGLAFVQTIKTARVSRGDPFNNLELIFYNEMMPAKHAANAVFPCGSGLVWRRTALHQIGDFPTWNLVEDVQSGVEALRRGWRGAYVPIIGATAQHAPEDIPNFYKQRGTWALDTVRLLVWGDLDGLNLRQRLQFAEHGFFYVQGLLIWTLVLIGVGWLVFDLAPLTTGPAEYTVHFAPFAIGLELFFLAWKGRQPYRALWGARELGVALAPVFCRAVLAAVIGGRHRKPTYRVTRKQHAFAIYWREVAPQAIALLVILSGFLYAVLVRQHAHALSPATLYWVILFVVLVGRFIGKSWFGVGLGQRVPAVGAPRL
jgi:cellulose synthase (UDP-forming)